MTEDRTIGVTEAGVGLSIITCLLALFGYVIVRQLGDSPRAETVAPTQPVLSESAIARGEIQPALGIQQDKPTEHQTSYAPQWLEPQTPQPGETFTR